TVSMACMQWALCPQALFPKTEFDLSSSASPCWRTPCWSSSSCSAPSTRRSSPGPTPAPEPVMHGLNLTLPTLAANLALDEALLLEAEAGYGSEVLRLWEWPHLAVVLGAGGRLVDDVDEAACRRDGVPILRRSSGRGTALLGPGCLLYSLILSYECSTALHDLHASYAFILQRIAAALTGILPGIKRAGISDLAAGGRKFSGNSQQRKQRHLLQHGTLLYDFGIALVGRYLRQPARQPDYRQQRDHAAFLPTLPRPAAELRRRLCAAWDADTEQVSWPQERTRQLTADKYTQDEWIRRR